MINEIKSREIIEIKLTRGTIEEAVSKLKKAHEEGKYAFVYIDGHILYSDNITLDSAYLTIKGKTRAQLEEVRQENRAKVLNQIMEERKSRGERIASLIDRGKEVIHPLKYNPWKNTVIKKIKGSYNGAEIEVALSIIEKLDKNGNIKEAIEIFEKNYGRSDFNDSVISLVFAFSTRGPEFYKKVVAKRVIIQNYFVIRRQSKKNIKILSKQV